MSPKNGDTVIFTVFSGNIRKVEGRIKPPWLWGNVSIAFAMLIKNGWKPIKQAGNTYTYQFVEKPAFA